MKESEKYKDDFIRDWIKTTRRDNASEGFTEKLMAQVDIEPISNINRYSRPVNKAFLIGTLIVFSSLLAVALFLPNLNWTVSSYLPSYSMPEINIPNFTEIFPEIKALYISIPIIILIASILLDRFLSKVFSSR